MSTIKLSQQKVFQYFDTAYLLKFILLFALLYGFNMAFFSITTPYGNYYSPFLDHYLNYINWLKASLIHTSNQMCHLIGINSYMPNSSALQDVGSTRLMVGESCLGLGVSSFWVAYILADGSSWKRKALWCLGGLASIWLINCLRITFMLLAYVQHWELIITSDYHTSFNVLAYGLVFLQIYLYNRSAGKALQGS